MKQNNINDIDLNIVSNEKKKIIIGIFSVLALVGVSLAYFFITKSSSLFNLNIKQQAEMNFLEGTENIMAKGIPIYDEDVSSDASYSIFSITNPGTTAIHANIYLEDINMSSDVFVSDDFKWSIEEGTGLTNEDFSDDYDNSVSGSFLKIDETDPTNKKVLIARNIILEPNETKYYKVRVWLRETGEDQTAFMGENIELKVSTSADSVALANASGEEVILTNTAYNSSVSNLKIYGNTVDGVSVGDKTKNLLNPIFSTRLWASTGSNVAITSDVSTYSQIVKVEPNTTYTFSGNCVGMNSNTMRIAFTKDYPDVGVVTIAQRQQLAASTYKSLTITTPEECNYLLLMTGTSQIYDYTDNQLQLEKGTTATEYEPYGYKIPITVSGKNLFDSAWENGFINTSSGVNQDSTTYIRSINYTKIKGGVAYYLTSPNIGGKDEGITIYWYFYDANKTYISRTVSYRDRKITPPEGAEYIRLSVFTTDLDAKIQIEKGSTATEYEPYQTPNKYLVSLNEPLRSNGDRKDYIDFERGKVVRWIDSNGNVLSSPTEEDITLPEIKTLNWSSIISADTTVKPTFELNY